MLKLLNAIAVVTILAGCAHQERVGAPIAGGATASATIRSATGRVVGHAIVREVSGGLRITVDADHLPPGQHGIHIHSVGQCDAPDFASAGGHWNPTGTKHGSLNPAGPHMGDMPNLVIAAGGRGSVGVNLPGGTLAGLLDADGAAIVIHAGPDDLMTDPSGNSGARLACGVFAAS